MLRHGRVKEKAALTKWRHLWCPAALSCVWWCLKCITAVVDQSMASKEWEASVNGSHGWTIEWSTFRMYPIVPLNTQSSIWVRMELDYLGLLALSKKPCWFCLLSLHGEVTWTRRTETHYEGNVSYRGV